MAPARRPTVATSLGQRLRRLRLLEALAGHALVVAVRIAAALPSRWVLSACDALGGILSVADRRGRRVAMQNLAIAFGQGMDARERRRVFRRSYRQVVRAVGLLLHLQPLTRERFLHWVRVPDDLLEAPQTRRLAERGAVFVSGHVGNWEILLGLRTLFRGKLPPTVFLVEAIPHEALNRVLARLRGHADLRTAFRKGGARAVISVVASGGTAALLVDRNVRRQHGGVYAPFFGLQARTTPLPAWIALRHGVPVYPAFCLPEPDGRYRLWLGPDLAADVEGEDDHARTVALLGRINAVLEDVIRARPDLWNWTLKRFKSRPHEALEGHPPYSLWDPDPPTRTM